jgi:hypothetical protein
MPGELVIANVQSYTKNQDWRQTISHCASDDVQSPLLSTDRALRRAEIV